VIPCSPRDKKIALTALDLIRDFGSNAGVEAFEGANTAQLAGDKDEADFLFAVSRKIDEYSGREPLKITKAEAIELFELL